MSRHLTARLGHDDGQTTVLTVGLCAVLVALMLVMLAVTTVQLQHRRLQSRQHRRQRPKPSVAPDKPAKASSVYGAFFRRSSAH